jgi:hypothetical protein
VVKYGTLIGVIKKSLEHRLTHTHRRGNICSIIKYYEGGGSNEKYEKASASRDNAT